MKSTTLERLKDLMEDPDEYDEDFIQPTSIAYELACDFVRAAEPAGIHPAAPATIGSGDIFLQWGRCDDDRYVRVCIQANGHPDIYVVDHDTRYMIDYPTVDDLEKELKWLMHSD